MRDQKTFQSSTSRDKAVVGSSHTVCFSSSDILWHSITQKVLKIIKIQKLCLKAHGWAFSLVKLVFFLHKIVCPPLNFEIDMVFHQKHRFSFKWYVQHVFFWELSWRVWNSLERKTNWSSLGIWCKLLQSKYISLG